MKIKIFLLVLVCLLLIGCSFSQFSQLEVMREHFGNEISIYVLPVSNYYLVNDGELWLVAVEGDRSFKTRETPKIIIKRRVIFTIRYNDPSTIM